MLITKKSSFTGIEHTLDLDVTQEQLDRYARHEAHVQNIFPHLSADEREFLMTGVTAEEWAEAFGDEDDGPDEDFELTQEEQAKTVEALKDIIGPLGPGEPLLDAEGNQIGTTFKGAALDEALDRLRQKMQADYQGQQEAGP